VNYRDLVVSFSVVRHYLLSQKHEAGRNFQENTLNNPKAYAVAVRDGNDLFVVVTICRELKGDLYVNWPSVAPHLEPHTSYHASGQTHHKAVDRKVHPELRNQAHLVLEQAYSVRPF